MNARTTWLLLAATAALLVLIVTVERPIRQARQAPVNLHVLPGLETARVTVLSIRHAGQPEIRMERTQDVWRVTRPVNTRADTNRIGQFLQFLSDFTWEHHIGSGEVKDRPEAATEFGLETPRLSLIIEQGRARHHLLFGTNTVVGNQVFMQALGADGYYLVNSDFLRGMESGVEPWRDPMLLPAGIGPVNFLRVKSGASTVELKRNVTNGFWRVTRPVDGRADTARIENLLGLLRQARIERFVTDQPGADLDRFGLQNPDLEITLGAGTNRAWTVQTGRATTNQPPVLHARMAGEPTIVLTAAGPWKDWRGTHLQFRERHLVTLPTNGIDRMEVEAAERFVITRAGTNWQVIEPVPFPADPLLVRDLLRTFSSTEVELEKAVVTDESNYGLAHPSASFRLRTTPRQGAAEFDLRIDFGTNVDGRIFVRRADEQSVQALPMSEFLRLPSAGWQLRDRRIWDFESTDVVALVVEQGGKILRLVRNEKLHWTVAPGSTGAINSFAVEESLHRLGELTAVYWIARGEKALDGYGLPERQFQITLELDRRGERSTRVLRLGRLTTLGHPFAAAQVDGQWTVFEFPLPLYREFILEHLSINGGGPALQ